MCAPVDFEIVFSPLRRLAGRQPAIHKRRRGEQAACDIEFIAIQNRGNAEQHGRKMILETALALTPSRCGRQ
jgi:hypothetical protein